MIWILLMACAGGPGPRGVDPAADWFPLVEGGTWTYSATFNGRDMQETRVALPVEVDGVDAWAFFVDEDIGKDNAIVFSNMFGLGVYARGAEGLETLPAFWAGDIVNLTADDAQLLLALPPVKGAATNLNTSSPDRQGPFTVEGFEALRLPAGRFEGCARIDLGQDSKAWLAPGVGLVKWIFVTGRVEELATWDLPRR